MKRRLLPLLMLILCVAAGYALPLRTAVAGKFADPRPADANERQGVRNDNSLLFADTLFADLDRDGLTDRVSVTDGLRIGFARADGSEKTVLLSEENGKIAISDMDRDGIPDILQQQGLLGGILIYRNQSMPALVPETYVLNEDEVLRISYRYEKDGKGPLNFITSINSNNIYMLRDSSGLTLQPVPDWHGSAELTVSYRRGSLADTLRMPVTVLPVNDPPRITPFTDPYVINEDGEFTISLQELQERVVDPDGDDINIRPCFPRRELRQQDSIFVYRPAENRFGPDTLCFEVSDGTVRDTLRLAVTVLPVNDAPVWRAIGDLVSPEDELIRKPYSFLYDHAEDLETPDSLLRFHAHSGKHAAISTEGGRVTIVPDENWFGTDTLMLTVRDESLSDTVFLRVIITPVNDPPQLSKLPVMTFNEDDTLYIDRGELEKYAFDVETPDEELKWQVRRLGSIRAFYNGETARLVASENWFGTDSVEITVSDGEIAVSRNAVIRVLP
ncbi:MAG: tandem-95 repeat protein, partial [Candidatus Marinimicrobia bacterium]|nr:tandem-95 repeat protein [Candidatus Neomarinimicrobiota bacterium]